MNYRNRYDMTTPTGRGGNGPRFWRIVWIVGLLILILAGLTFFASIHFMTNLM